MAKNEKWYSRFGHALTLHRLTITIRILKHAQQTSFSRVEFRLPVNTMCDVFVTLPLHGKPHL